MRAGVIYTARVTAPEKVPPVGTLLAEADTRLTSQPDEALALLVRAYALCPSYELAELVERFEGVRPPPPFEGDTAEFVRRARKPSVQEVGSLARAVLGPKSADTSARLEALARLPVDPRVARALERLVREVPYTSNTARPTMTQILALFAKVVDGAVAARAPAIEAGWKFRENQRDWMRVQLRRAVEARRPGPALDEASLARVAALSAKLVPAPAPRKDAHARSLEGLLAAVYAAPHDDAPRLVLADFLLEKGDPRGELIALQLQKEKGKGELAREQALLETHGRKWLGGLADVVLKDVVFRRGFPAVVTARFRHSRDVEAHGEAPEWATIEEIAWTSPGSSSRDQQRFIFHVPRTLRPRVMSTHTAGLEQLLERDEPLPIEDLRLHTLDDVEVLARFKSSKLFPALRRLSFRGGIEPADLSEGWMAQIPEIVCTAHDPATAAWVLACSARAAVSRFTVDLDWIGTFHFVRGEDGLLSRLVVEPKGEWNEYSLQRLGELPDGILTTIDAPEKQRRLVQAALGKAVRKKGAKPPPAPRAAEPELLSVEAMSFREKGLAVVAPGHYFLIDTQSRTRSTERRLDEVGCAAFTPDGRGFVCGVGADLSVYDAATGARGTKTTLPSTVFEVVFDATSGLLAARCQKQVVIARLTASGLEVTRSVPVGKRPKNVRAIAFADDLLVATYGEPKLGVFDGPRPTRLSLPSMGTSVCVVPGRRFLVTCVGGEVLLLERDGTVVARARVDGPSAATLVPGGERVGVLARTGLVVLTLPSLKTSRTLPGISEKGFTFSPDGRKVAVLTDGRVEVLDVDVFAEAAPSKARSPR